MFNTYSVSFRGNSPYSGLTSIDDPEVEFPINCFPQEGRAKDSTPLTCSDSNSSCNTPSPLPRFPGNLVSRALQYVFGSKTRTPDRPPPVIRGPSSQSLSENETCPGLLRAERFEESTRSVPEGYYSLDEEGGTETLSVGFEKEFRDLQVTRENLSRAKRFEELTRSVPEGYYLSDEEGGAETLSVGFEKEFRDLDASREKLSKKTSYKDMEDLQNKCTQLDFVYSGDDNHRRCEEYIKKIEEIILSKFLLETEDFNQKLHELDLLVSSIRRSSLVDKEKVKEFEQAFFQFKEETKDFFKSDRFSTTESRYCSGYYELYEEILESLQNSIEYKP